MWDYYWDAENRLVKMDTSVWAYYYGGADLVKVLFDYDHLHRRIRKQVIQYSEVTGNYEQISDRRFTYEGWNVIMEDEWVTAKTRTYAWGLDIQGSLQGAAGVGGLVALHDKIENLSGKLLLPGYDANGNVAVMVNGTNGDLEAAYEYGPFGESLRQEGPSAKLNPFRFSTKYTDDETGLNYYGRRYYDPRNGRFLGRDPLKEKGGMNLYAFVANNTVNRWDYLGMNDLMQTLERMRNAIVSWRLGSNSSLNYNNRAQPSPVYVPNVMIDASHGVDFVATQVSIVANDPAVQAGAAAVGGAGLIIASGGTIAAVAPLAAAEVTFFSGSMTVLASTGAVLSSAKGTAMIAAAFSDDVSTNLGRIEQMPTSLPEMVGFVPTQITGNPGFQQAGSAANSIISLTSSIQDITSASDVYSIASDAFSAGSQMIDAYENISVYLDEQQEGGPKEEKENFNTSNGGDANSKNEDEDEDDDDEQTISNPFAGVSSYAGWAYQRSLQLEGRRFD